MQGSSSRIARNIAAYLPSTAEGVAPRGQAAASLVARGASTLEKLPGALFAVVSVAVIGFYWSIERSVIVRALLMACAPERRERLRAFIDASEERVGAFLRGEAVLCFAVGLLAFVAYLVLRIPYAPVLGILAAVMEIITFLGPVLGAAPAVLVALSLSPSAALSVVGATIVIQLVESYVLAPRILGRSVGVSAFTLVLALAAASALFGVVGALLAIPGSAVLQVAFEQALARREARGADETIPTRDASGALRYEATQIGVAARRLVVRGGHRPRAEVASLVEEVESIATGVAGVLGGVSAGQAR
jgi:predicted PurR-regulated permease PerM